jgi:hypothetical protein
MPTEPFDRLNPPTNAQGIRVSNKGKPVEMCVGCLRYYEKKVGIIHHYKACEPFKAWRHEWVLANLSGALEVPQDSGEAGRDVGDTSRVSTSKHKIKHKSSRMFSVVWSRDAISKLVSIGEN